MNNWTIKECKKCGRMMTISKGLVGFVNECRECLCEEENGFKGNVEDVMKKFPWLKKAKVKDAVVEIDKGKLVWRSGWWLNGVWEEGIWRYGEWFDGTWKNGIWHDGRWSKGTWENGTWKDGQWMNGEWNGGTFEGGIWRNGEWNGGAWKKGKWIKGMIKGKMSKTPPSMNESKEENAYQKYFKEMLKKEGVKSPAELSDEEKKAFFNKVDAGWKAKKKED